MTAMNSEGSVCNVEVSMLPACQLGWVQLEGILPPVRWRTVCDFTDILETLKIQKECPPLTGGILN